ncbi:mannosyltransferase [Neosynechococcus sphagnicola sy1]|uniref:Mannosyltransferase n=1 Tax=Neosynechococcus sphagnicola sy1 TaxID=1497020 RepID=A0A098TKZ4_9CYAN|nr:glycosyltransferase family 1 protein [Neosynechococcus sphagnicola]KGF72517.1 mannosyltransferase [Neosynechococcus sphagnicola sy1]
MAILANSLLINLSFLIPQPTGLSTYASNLLPYFKSLDPILLTSRSFPDYACYPVAGNLTADKGTRGHFNRLLWTQFQLPKLYRNLAARLLFSPITEAPLSVSCRTVVMFHDLIPLRFPRRFSPLTPYFRYYIPQVLRQSLHIVCNSEASARDLVDFYGIPARQITPIPLAHDPQHFRFLDLPTQNYFLYLGRTVPYKNLQRVIAALSAIPHSDAQLWVAGPPDPRYLPRLNQQIVNLGLAARVKFLGYVAYENLPVLINQAIALVFPSLWEGFGLPALEAMACGTPVITSNLSSLPEVTRDAALLVNPYEVGAIAQAMEMVATDTQLHQHLRGAGLQRAAEFSWAKTGEATAAILRRYLG